MDERFDMHCHLGFDEDPTALASALDRTGVAAFSCGVHPRDYGHDLALLGSCTNVRVGLGMHPWWVADGRVGDDDLQLFVEQAQTAQFIGEIGLDFGKRHGVNREAQVAALDRALAACPDGCVVSLHTVASVDVVLDLLERHRMTDRASCIFHWFSGSSDQLARAVKAGCWFSFGERSLATGRGREYAKAVPLKRLLLETDLPGKEPELQGAQLQLESLARAESALESLRGSDALMQVAKNSRLLFSQPFHE